MITRKSLWSVLLAPLVLAGCASNTITNITPQQHVRNANGLYPVEARWDSNQRSVRKDSIRPYVVVGMEYYPMRMTTLTKNRWETVVPVPATQKFLNYRFKFDYEYDSIPIPRADSKSSPTYQLEIIER